MASFINKYKYIIFIIIIFIFLFICFKNYKYIEAFSYIDCPAYLSLPPFNITSLKQRDSPIDSNTQYYTCQDASSQLAFYGYNIDSLINENYETGKIKLGQKFFNDNEISYNDLFGQCLQYADASGYDFFTLYKYKYNDNNIVTGCIYMDISSSIAETINNNIIVDCIKNDNKIPIGANNDSQTGTSTWTNIPTIRKYIDNMSDLYPLGVGGFTNSGAEKLLNSHSSNYIGKDIIGYQNPLCNLQLGSMQKNEYIKNNCINTIKDNSYINENSNRSECNKTIEDIDTINKKINEITLNSDICLNYIDKFDDTHCSQDISNCITVGIETSGNILNSTISKYNEYKNDLSNNNTTHNIALNNYKEILELQNNSELDVKSIFSKYLFLCIVFIITIIMFILNLTTPDIITSEILISYIIFIVLIIFVTSKYFNVDYGPLNSILSLQL